MQILNSIENFLFCEDEGEIFIEEVQGGRERNFKDEKKSKIEDKFKILVSINYLYLFSVKKKNDLLNLNDDRSKVRDYDRRNQEQDIKLETFLFKRFDLKDLFIMDYSKENCFIIYHTMIKGKEHAIKIKFSSPYKQYINILILICGWNLASIETPEKKQIPINIILFHLLDKYIVNNFIFILDSFFFSLVKKYNYFMQIFIKTIAIVSHIKFEFIFDKASFGSLYRIFKKEIPWCLTQLDVSSTNLDDCYFKKTIIPIIKNSNDLIKLNLSHNLLTNTIFNYIRQEIPEWSILKNLNLSYNNITSRHLAYDLVNLIYKKWPYLEYLDLRGNKINGKFLKALYSNFPNSNRDTQDGEKRKSDCKIDLRDTVFDLEKMGYRFYLKRKLDISSILESNDTFKNFKSKDFNQIKFIYDPFFDKNQVDFYKISASPKNFTLNVKCFEIHETGKYSIKTKFIEPTEKSENDEILNSQDMIIKENQNTETNPNKESCVIKKSERTLIINETDELSDIDEKKEPNDDKDKEESELYHKDFIYYYDQEPQLDFYRRLFKFFFLLDFYFDPLMNSFSSYESKFLMRMDNYLNDINHYDQYWQLAKYIKSMKNNPIYERDEQKDMQREIPLEEAKQMYCDYVNLLMPYESDDEGRGEGEIKNQKIVEINEVINEVFRKIFKKNILQPDEMFNPNADVYQMSFFFYFLIYRHDYKVKIPYTTLNKYISRVKIESILSIRERTHYSLNYLIKITSRLNLSIYPSVNKAFNQVKKKAEIILQGLSQVLNFEGYYSGNFAEPKKNFLFQTNNFLDMFLKKAEGIDLVCDLVYIARYVQYLRDNILRIKYYEKLKEEIQTKGITSKYNMYEEYSKLNNEYKKITKPEIFNIPPHVKYKQLSLHPEILDYVELSECQEKILRNDLDEISKYITSSVSYGKRNLYDRLKFLFVNSSKKRKNEDNLYKLHKGNLNLKVMRILFRFFNNLDIEIEKKNIDISKSVDIKNASFDPLLRCSTFIQNKNLISDYLPKADNTKRLFEEGIAESLENIAIEENNLRIIKLSDEEEEAMQNFSDIEKNNRRKIKLLQYCDDLSTPQTLLDVRQVKGITEELIETFENFTVLLFSKCQLRLLGPEKITPLGFCEILQNYIKYFLKLKMDHLHDTKYWKFQNLECFYQLFRLANKNNFEQDYKEGKENKKEEENKEEEKEENEEEKEEENPRAKEEFDYSFAFLTMMCWYFEFSEPMIKRVKGLAHYLFTRMIHRKFCKQIIRALSYPMRYNWVMSSFEIERKLFSRPMEIEVIFPSNENKFKEVYIIKEDTTASDLFEQIKKNSIYLKGSDEKGFYWIYAVSNDNINNAQNLNSDDLIVEYLGSLEENSENFNIESLESEKDKQTISQLNSSNYVIFEEKTFHLIHFEIRRRIFTPEIYNGNIFGYTNYEQEILYNQVKNFYQNSDIGIGEEIAIACYFEAKAHEKRKEKINEDVDNIVLINKNDSNLSHVNNSNNGSLNHLGMNDYLSDNKENEEDKNKYIDDYIHKEINYPPALGKEKTLKETFEAIKGDIIKMNNPKRKFFELVKNYPVLLSNNYEVTIFQCNDSFPDRFLISLSREKICFLYRKNYRKFFEFQYDEIVRCLAIDNYRLSLVVNIAKDDLDGEEERFELVVVLESYHNRFIMEDILSYSQLFLITRTETKKVQRKTIETHKQNNKIVLYNLGDYHLIYQRTLPFREKMPKCEYKGIEMEIWKIREKMHNTKKYKEYKEEKERRLKEEEEKKKIQEPKKKGKLDIEQLKDIPRMIEENSESQENEDFDEDSYPIIKINNQRNQTTESTEEKKEEIDLQLEEAKRKEEEEIMRKEEEERKKKEAEEEIKQKKLQENREKMEKANASMAKLLSVDISSESENQEENENGSDEQHYYY